MKATHATRLGGLWILFAVQILVAIWLWWPRQRGPVTGQPWLTFSPKAVTTITLTNGGSDKHHTLTLQKHDDKWRLPGAGDFPADSAKVDGLLSALASLKGSLPVAVTRDAAQRFHVAKNQYEEKLTLTAGSKQLAQLYVGNAAGANLVYLRRAGDHVIEANTLPSRLVSASDSDWRDQHLLRFAADSVHKLVLPHLTLVKQGSGWTAKDSKTALDPSKVKALVGQLAQLDFTKVLGKKAEYAPSATSFQVSVDAKGQKLVYDFAAVHPEKGKPGKGNKKAAPKTVWRMTRSDLPYVFTVSSELAGKLKNDDVQSVAKTNDNTKTAAKGVSATNVAQDNKGA
jgi:hypothetical protein